MRLLAQLEEEVKRAVTDGTDDFVLTRLVDITTRAIFSKRELFDNPLHAPVFYERHFRPWVQEALDEKDAISNFHNNALKSLGLIHSRE